MSACVVQYHVHLLWRNCGKSGQTAGGTPLLEGFAVPVGEQQCAMRNVGLARLVEHGRQA
jgi:hypothetical protein